MRPRRSVWPLAYLCCNFVACTKPESISKNNPGEPSLDGVYGHGDVGDFERETVVIEGSTFKYWFKMDETLPNIFPLSGTFVRSGKILDLTYSVPGTQLDDFRSVFPPTQIQVEEHSGFQTLRTVRFSDPVHDAPTLFRTTLGLADDRSNFPVVVGDDKIVPQLREFARLHNSKKD